MVRCAPLIPIPMLVLALAQAPAQVVSLGGSLSDGAGGPLQSGSVYHVVSHLTVPLGTTLTVHPGAILKFSPSAGMEVHGTLLVNGTPAAPAVFTSLQDDSAGGDTNGNGPSAGSPGQYLGLRFHPTSDASQLRHLALRFGGSATWSALILSQADITIESCTVSSFLETGLNLQGSSRPAVTGCTFSNNGLVAIDQVPIDAVPGFTGNTAAGNGGDYTRISVGATTRSLTIGPAQQVNGAFVLSTHLSVAAGTTLTVLGGVVFKLQSSGLLGDVYGTLMVQGTASAPVVLTSFRDDVHGGDTNGDGPSTGAPLDWRGLRFQPTADASVLDHLVLRYGGNFGDYGLSLLGADVSLRECTIQACAFSGLGILGGALPSVRGCSFLGNGDVAARVSLNSVPGFVSNSASGNAGGNHLLVVDGAVTGARTIDRSSLPGGVVVLGQSVSVPAGATLTIGQGVVVKLRWSNVLIDVAGHLDVLGTGFEPVVFTSFKDDAWGGDTNLDGPSSGAPLDWLGIRFQSTAGPSLVEHALVRYGGNAGFACVLNHSPQTVLRSIRVESSGFAGFQLSAHALPHLDNLVAFGCSGHGILLTGGSFYVQFATSVRNSGAGVFRSAGYTGSVQNSIAWSNSGGNFVGLQTGQLVNSNGDPAMAGVLGNMFVVPGFVDEPGGDLRLGPGSLLLDTADFGAAVDAVKDHLENSRILDDDVNSVAVADRGAYERAAWDLSVTGEPRPGSVLSFTVLGSAGTSIFALGALDGEVQTQPYGFILLGLQPLPLAILPVGVPLTIAIPGDPGLVGLRAGVQAVTFPPATTLFGSVSRLYRATIRP